MATIPDRACARAARLLSEQQDRPLRLGERWTLRLHLALCDGCTQYARQVQLMREAMRRWSREAGDDLGPP